jgi:hypothetical protein
MPIGLIVLLVLSFTIFRQARRSGRRGWLWICLLWMSTIGAGLAATALSGFYLVYLRGTDADEYELRVMLRTPAAIGMLTGAFAATARASKPAAQGALAR